jgi:hypothetical protein
MRSAKEHDLSRPYIAFCSDSGQKRKRSYEMRALISDIVWRVSDEVEGRGAKTKTFNSGYSLVVTHLTTNPPVRCLNRAERTGSLVLNVLWSNVEDMLSSQQYKLVVITCPEVLRSIQFTIGSIPPILYRQRTLIRRLKLRGAYTLYLPSNNP